MLPEEIINRIQRYNIHPVAEMMKKLIDSFNVFYIREGIHDILYCLHPPNNRFFYIYALCTFQYVFENTKYKEEHPIEFILRVEMYRFFSNAKVSKIYRRKFPNGFHPYDCLEMPQLIDID